ncbi:ATP-binding protein [Actinomadura sp. NEAU-AAG7]|uniref:ATP-binding protein n=1 Tax=Actinomadura sp. NEAU-AAG7 TaxID=2839640 RepID=UPI001BE3E11D|nr:ATP-binding protein [Actinomadura sp. NEAU-AAG7]MBT2210024.1 ATP-binding protein [Actinomadura sp. NEAU-AAG7]
MTLPALRFDTLILPGADRAAGRARQWLRGLLGEHPALGDAALCMSELVTNAVRYTESGRKGHVRVEVSHSERIVCMEVVDDGGSQTVPHLAVVDGMGTCGRGLIIVAYMADRWGVGRRGGGHAVWFEMSRDG